MKRMSVLIVDACARTRELLRDLLVEHHAAGDVHESDDAAGALAILAHRRVEAVVVDVDTPGRDGLALLAALRRASPRCLLVALTNDPSGPRRRACLARGADRFFDKSLEFERAIEAVRHRARGEGP